VEAIGRSEAARCKRFMARSRAAITACVTVAFGFCLTQTPAAIASPASFTWTGRSTVTEEWSAAANWEGDSTPTTGEDIEALTFPRLTNEACADGLGTEPCYISYNNLSGLSAESIQIDDGNDYLIGGEELSLGSGGLTASPASGTSGETGDIVETPIHLTAPQTWSIANRGDAEFADNNLLLAGSLSGYASALTVDLSKGPGLYLVENEMEVGPISIDGRDTGEPGVLNGFVALIDANLNSSDGQPVELSHAFLEGSGSVGPLQTNDAEIDVGSGVEPAEGIEATSVKLDSASEVGFEISGAGTQAQHANSQLDSRGAVELNDASIEVVVRSKGKGDACPTLTAGETFTLVSTSGKLSGLFGNASADGDEIPLRFAKACTATDQTLRIGYHKSGGTHTVTATVEEAPTTTKEEQEATKRHQEEAAKQHEEEVKEQHEEEEAATRKKQEEEEAAVTKKHEEEEAAVRKKHEEEERATRKKEEEEAAKKRQEEEAKREVEEEGSRKAQEEAATTKRHQEEAAETTKREAAEASRKLSEEQTKQAEEAAAAAKKHEEETAKNGVLGIEEVSPDATVASTSLQASASGAVSVKISCPGGESSCSGTVTLRTLDAVVASVAGAAKAKAAILTLATGSFSVPGGGTKTVTLHLSAKALSLLVRSHLLRVRSMILAHNPGGGVHTAEAVLALRAAKPKAKHGKG
jgi:DNA segregation ATPase FtsK/SpoIIIE-like protein